MSYETSSDEYDSDDYRLVYEEYKRNGKYDFDTTVQANYVSYHAVVFEDSEVAKEPETDGVLVYRLSKVALQKYNYEEHTNLELVRVVKANWNIGMGYTFNITFEAKHPSRNEPIPFQACVGHHPWYDGSTVYEVQPKP